MTTDLLTPPRDRIRELVAVLNRFDNGIVVARGDGWSANLCGRVVFGPDGDDPDAVRLADCGCHVHVDWQRAVSYSVSDEDVGYGAEPVVVLRDAAGRPVIRLFYQATDRTELLTALAQLPTQQPTNPKPTAPIGAGAMDGVRAMGGSATRVAIVHTSGRPLLAGTALAGHLARLARLGMDAEQVVAEGEAVHGYAPADPAARAAALAAVLTDPEIPVVWAAQGGYGATELIPHLGRMLPDRLPPTTFAGFSDISFLGVWLASRYPGLRYVHATNALDPLALGGRREDVARLLTVLHGRPAPPVSAVLEPAGDPAGSPRAVRLPEPITGPVVPVNLSLAACLPGAIAGLPPGCVLFVEDVDDDLRRLLRCVDVLVTSGLADRVAAFVVGALHGCRDETGGVLAPNRLAGLIADRTGRPAYVWPEFGHGPARTPLILGDLATIEPTTDPTDPPGVVGLTIRPRVEGEGG